MIDVLPPRMNISLNARLRLNAIAGVLDEMTQVCGVTITDDLRKGVVERDVIKTIVVSFMDSPTNICARIRFEINWERLEFLAKTDEGQVLFSNVDFNKRLAPQLDKHLYDAVKVYANWIKKKYNITKIKCTYWYQDKYTATTTLHDAAREYMGHVSDDSKPTITHNIEFAKEMSVAFKGLDDTLRIVFEMP